MYSWTSTSGTCPGRGMEAARLLRPLEMGRASERAASRGKGDRPDGLTQPHRRVEGIAGKE